MAAEKKRKVAIRAVAFEHGDHWVAQCLEYDIATQARTLDDLLYELERIIAAHILGSRGRTPFANLPRAPSVFWQMYEKAVTKVAPVKPFTLVPADRRPLVEIRKAAARAA
jgi:hypothetical protein